MDRYRFLWNLHEAPDGHLVNYIMMICVVQTTNWWCGYVDWLMVMDHVDDVLMEPLLCWWKPSVNMHGHGSIHRDSSTCTLGIFPLSKAPNQDGVVQKALKQGVGWNCMSRPRSATNRLNKYKWKFTSKWWVCECNEDVWYLIWSRRGLLHYR